jgi:hypothetical protein
MGVDTRGTVAESGTEVLVSLDILAYILYKMQVN